MKVWCVMKGAEDDDGETALWEIFASKEAARNAILADFKVENGDEGYAFTEGSPTHYEMGDEHNNFLISWDIEEWEVKGG